LLESQKQRENLLKRKRRFDPQAIGIRDAVALFAESSERPITEAMIREDLEAGAPVNRNGTLNLIHYTAWLVRWRAHGD